MKKRILALCLCFALAFSVTACGKDKKKASSGNVQKVGTEDTSNSEADMSGTKYAADVTLPDYKSITVAESLVEVTDDLKKKVDFNVLLATIADFSHVEQLEGTVAECDVVNIDYVGTIDGAEFEGGSAEGTNLGIGSGDFIEGFEDGLIGVNTGETVTLSLTFPDDYDEEFAGKDVVFKVTVNYILGINDEFISDNSELLRYFLYRYFSKAELVTTEEEYRQIVNDGLRVQNIISCAFEKISEETEITENEVELSEFIAENKASYEQTATEYDMTLEEVLSYTVGFSTVEEYETYLKQIHKNMALMMALAAEEEISVTDEEYENVINAMIYISSGDYTDIASFEADYAKQDMVDDIIYGKVYYKIAEYIQVVPDAEADIKPTEESTEETTSAAE